MIMRGGPPRIDERLARALRSPAVSIDRVVVSVVPSAIGALAGIATGRALLSSRLDPS